MKDEVPAWMEYGVCKACDRLIRIEEAYDHEVEISMEANWYGENNHEETLTKDVILWCTEKCKIADTL